MKVNSGRLFTKNSKNFLKKFHGKEKKEEVKSLPPHFNTKKSVGVSFVKEELHSF